MGKLIEQNKRGDRLGQLKELSSVLSIAIEGREDDRNLPQLSRQLRETLEAIAEIEAKEEPNDEISEILKEVDGQSRAVR